MTPCGVSGARTADPQARGAWRRHQVSAGASRKAIREQPPLIVRAFLLTSAGLTCADGVPNRSTDTADDEDTSRRSREAAGSRVRRPRVGHCSARCHSIVIPASSVTATTCCPAAARLTSRSGARPTSHRLSGALRPGVRVWRRSTETVTGLSPRGQMPHQY